MPGLIRNLHDAAIFIVNLPHVIVGYFFYVSLYFWSANKSILLFSVVKYGYPKV